MNDWIHIKDNKPPRMKTLILLHRNKVFCGHYDDCISGCDSGHEMGILVDKVAYEWIPDFPCIDLNEIDGWILLESLEIFKKD